MELLLYKIKLAIRLGLFILSLSANVSNRTKPIILGLFILGLLTVIGGLSIANLQKETKKEVAISASTIIPTETRLYEKKFFTNFDLQNEILFWESVLEKQPNSRDVLLNLSHLYSALGDDIKATEFKNKALEIDPNNPLFE